MRVIRTIGNWRDIHSHLCEQRARLAAPETSRAGEGRDQFWLPWEPRYATRDYIPGASDPRLWTYLQRLLPQADLAQVFYGNKAIGWHRDASYANTQAWILSLGVSRFESILPSGEVQGIDLAPGQLLQFNCKLRHRAVNVQADRIGIGLWSAKIPLPA